MPGTGCQARGVLRFFASLGVLLTLLACAATAREIEQVRLDLAGAAKTTVSGQIVGYQTIDYLVETRAGQTLFVDMATRHLATYFNVLSPGSNDVAIFTGSIAGNSFAGKLDQDGIYKIRLYMMRSAARRDERASYRLDISLKVPRQPDLALLGTPTISPGSTQWDLELQGIHFAVESSGEGSLRRLRIVPAGLEIDNRPIEREIDGSVSGLEVADLDADGSPELYVYVASAGSGSYGSLVAYAANRRKSLSEIYLPSLEGTPAAEGYLGHDQLAVVENRLVRRFPLYRQGDVNAAPSGGMRQLQYRLSPGEAGWLLEVDRVVDY